MLHYRLHQTDRFDAEGGVTHGNLMVGEDGIVRWLSHPDLARMAGVGAYSGSFGYAVYDDGERLPA